MRNAILTGRRLRVLRLRAGLSQVELAALAGYHSNSISRHEALTRLPRKASYLLRNVLERELEARVSRSETAA
jgi:transcriptional regulator with XRE-family HTH domain